MSKGALIVAGAYAMIGALSLQAGADLVGWAWLALFFVVLTVGELYILPTGLSLFARLAPPGYGATTVAAWFLAIFTGSMTAGLVGTLWSRMEPGPFFFLLAGIAGAAALLLRLMDPLVTPVEMRDSAQKV